MNDIIPVQRLWPIDVVNRYGFGFLVGNVVESLLMSGKADDRSYFLERAHFFSMEASKELAQRNTAASYWKRRQLLEGFVSKNPFRFKEGNTLFRLDQLKEHFGLEGPAFDALRLILAKTYKMDIDGRIQTLINVEGFILLALRQAENDKS